MSPSRDDLDRALSVAYAEIDTLRAQLAEAHALLRELLPLANRAVKSAWSQGIIHRAEAALSASAEPIHNDDIAINTFASVMKSKMAASRDKGRSGWDDKEQCTAEWISELLRGHVAKGDPVDVANFCMMLHQRGEKITLGEIRSVSAEQSAQVERDERAEFEAWKLRTQVGEHGSWDAWQARAALGRKS